MPILNYTTKVDSMKTAGEIVNILGRKGALEVHQQFTAGRIVGISFVFQVACEPVKFYLPVNVDGVHAHMRKIKRSGATQREQAERVAWRIVKDWVEVQIALVESNQAEMGQVFMPYAMLANGQQMYAAFTQQVEQKRLGGGHADSRV
jgi:hypothetical protein